MSTPSEQHQALLAARAALGDRYADGVGGRVVECRARTIHEGANAHGVAVGEPVVGRVEHVPVVVVGGDDDVAEPAQGVSEVEDGRAQAER